MDCVKIVIGTYKKVSRNHTGLHKEINVCTGQAYVALMLLSAQGIDSIKLKSIA